MSGLAGKSNSLQSKVLIHLRCIFTVAMENGLVAKSPVSSTLKAGGKQTEEKEPLTPEESLLLLERVKDVRARTFLLIALHTGMRRGEILGLMWEDIDFRKKVIHVRHNAIIKEKVTAVSEALKTKAAPKGGQSSKSISCFVVISSCSATASANHKRAFFHLNLPEV